MLLRLTILALAIVTATADEAKIELLHHDSFDGDLTQWKVEQMPGGSVRVQNGQLEINDNKGCTVWFKNKLTGSVSIEFEANFVLKGGPHDRLSDLNCFWMATDPNHPKDIFADQSRTGQFKTYHPLKLYYVGYGGNHNTTTRFRRYPGDGTRPLLPKHDLKAKKYLLKPNKTVKIRLIADGKTIQYWRDGECIFDLKDEQPLRSGWFAFRTVNSHILIDNFKITRLPAN